MSPLKNKNGSIHWEDFGTIFYTWSHEGLQNISFSEKQSSTKEDHPALKKFFKAYREGHEAVRDFPLDIQNYTSFQRHVWHIISAIPFGEVRSYQWITDQMGQPAAVRAVGQAVGANPFPIVIPCHRVVNANGELGGFSGGIEWKKKLLAMEGTQVCNFVCKKKPRSILRGLRKGGLGI